VQVLRATDAGGRSYTVQRYRIADGGPRGMLVAQLNGLIACPEHLAVALLDAFLDSDGLHAVVVLGDGGGSYLRDVLEARGRLPEQNAAIVLRQALAALGHLHGQGLVHNDVDARNLLVSPQGQVRLCGFWRCAAAPAAAAAAAGGGRPARRLAGPFVHMAPERILGLGCGFPADVWSLGIAAAEMLLGRAPHDMARFAGPDALFEFKRWRIGAGPGGWGGWRMDWGGGGKGIVAGLCWEGEEGEQLRRNGWTGAGQAKRGLGGRPGIRPARGHGQRRETACGARRRGWARKGKGGRRAVVSEPSPSLPRGEFSHDARLFVDACLTKDLNLRATVPGLRSHFFLARHERFCERFLGHWVGKARDIAARARQAADAAAAAAAAGGRQGAAGGGDEVFLRACSLAHQCGRTGAVGGSIGVRAPPGSSGPALPQSGAAASQALPARPAARANRRMTIAAAFAHVLLHPDALADRDDDA
jgi:serine/threonine protein kinase